VGPREGGSENSGFYQMLGMSYPYEESFASQEGLCSLELVNFAMGSWFFTAFTLTLNDSPLLWKQKEGSDVSGIAVTEGGYKLQTFSFVKINQTIRPTSQCVYIFLLFLCPALSDVSTA